jgi:perosamine synthetase
VIPLFRVHMPAEVDEPLLQTLHSGFIGQGPRVEEFEAKFERTLGLRTTSALSLNSGTSALTLAMRLADVEGGEVITTPMTCMATNTPILDNRAIPVWADVDPDTGLIDPDDVRRQITQRTRAIVGVDWGGTPCDWLALNVIGPWAIRDAAHALGAPPQPADLTCFSFQAIKHISSVDGGVLVCREPEHYRRGKLLRWYGLDREGPRTDFRCEEDVEDWGYKMHMNDVTATIGLVQLDHLERVVAQHRANAAYYRANLPPAVKSAVPADLAHDSAFWLFTVLLADRETRDAFMEHMNARGVACSKVHARMDGHTLWRRYTTRELPGVTAFYDRQCSIPVHWALTAEERATVLQAMHDFRPARVHVA